MDNLSYPIQFPQVLDNTIISSFDACEQRAKYNYFLHLAGSTISPDLHAGGAIAKGLEITRKAYWKEQLSPNDAVERGVRAFMKFWGDYDPPDYHAKDFINTLAGFIDYFREYPLDADPIVPYIRADGNPAVEYTFAEPLPILHPTTGDPLLYGGRFDLLGYYNDLVCIVDEKTTYAMGSTWAKPWAMRGQFLGYCWGAQRAGLTASTAIVRGIAIQKTQIKHAQAIVSFPKWQIERWYDHMLAKVDKMVWAFQNNRWKLSYGEACGSYGGCSMMDLCTVENEEEWYSGFSTREWSPLAQDPTDA